MSKRINLLKKILCFLIVLVTIISVIDFCCFDFNFYHNEYSKLNTAEDIGVSEDDLDTMTSTLLDYLKGSRENIDLQLEVKGVNREIFDNREKLHMIDVKDLYDKVLLVRYISIVLIFIILVYLFTKKGFNNLSKAYNSTLLLYGFIFSIIGMFCLIDFNTFWTDFHKIFFTKNDYWLLDPKTEIMINMVPEQFFFDLVVRIVIISVIFVIIYSVIFKFIDKKVAKND